MATAGKKFRAAEANVDRNRTYTIPDAASLTPVGRARVRYVLARVVGRTAERNADFAVVGGDKVEQEVEVGPAKRRNFIGQRIRFWWQWFCHGLVIVGESVPQFSVRGPSDGRMVRSCTARNFQDGQGAGEFVPEARAAIVPGVLWRVSRF
jgi:hypothetical protein